MRPGILAALTLAVVLSCAAARADDDPTDPEMAKLQERAESGDAEAELQLGDAYRNGEGVKQDAHQAVHWTRKAAEQGNADAQFNLGFAYRAGDGVPMDKVESYMWFDLSAKQGNERAVELRKTVSETMTDDEIEAARNRSYHWKPEQQ